LYSFDLTLGALKQKESGSSLHQGQHQKLVVWQAFLEACPLLRFGRDERHEFGQRFHGIKGESVRDPDEFKKIYPPPRGLDLGNNRRRSTEPFR
jgi:hypothetical protein